MTLARKIAHLMQPKMLQHYIQYILTPGKLVRVTKYRDEAEYFAHQKQKTNDPARRALWLGAEWDLKMKSFEGIFARHRTLIKSPGRALCLGARTGQEVQVLRDMGVDAIGVDLVAAPPLVVEGDVHNLAFDDNSFDFTFTNIFDHVLHPDKFIAEIERTLKPGGHAVIHFIVGPDLDEYSVQVVKDPGAIAGLFKQSDIIANHKITNPADPMNHEIIARKR